MNLRQVAEIAVARLGLPVPMAKLVTVQAIGRALADQPTADVFAEALADWLLSRELESECLEALFALLVATPGTEVVARLRRSISRPSLASDLVLSIATDAPTLVASWPGCHSGPAPKLLVLDEEERLLRRGTFVPPLFTQKLEGLQERSGRPFVRQWAFEYSMLEGRHGGQGDGHLDYFLGSDGENVGQFVTRRAHLARSAYLRTLACAVQHWKMPEEVAVHCSALALPAEPIFARVAPIAAPAWVEEVQCRGPVEDSHVASLAHALVGVAERMTQRKLMHCSLAIFDTPTCHVDIEVFAVSGAQASLDPGHAIRFYHHMLGDAYPARDGLRAFMPTDMGSEAKEILGFVPVLMPVIGRTLGYLQSDLLGRIPYVPVSTASVPLEIVPGLSGVTVVTQGRAIGSWDWWIWDWKPGQPAEWERPTGTSVFIEHDAAHQMAQDLDGPLEHLWRVEIWRREKDYGEWVKTKLMGVVRRT